MVFSCLCCCHSSFSLYQQNKSSESKAMFRQVCLYQQNKSSESKAMFRQARYRYKRALEATKLHMLIKQKRPSLPRNLALRTFCEMPIVLSTKVNLLYLLYSTTWRCCLLHLIRLNCLIKTFLRTIILIIQISLYLFSLLELI